MAGLKMRPKEHQFSFALVRLHVANVEIFAYTENTMLDV